MSTSSISRVIVIQNPQGLHARPAQMFVETAMQFQSRVELLREGQRIDGKSMLDVLTLAATHGTELVLEADGEDAEEAVETLSKLVENGFGVAETEELEPNSRQEQQG